MICVCIFLYKKQYAILFLVVGGDDRIDELQQMAKQNDTFKLGSLNILCLSTPCHTKGHICYYVTDAQGDSKAVFTGDTLFLGGCGRFFEGDGSQMNEALNVKLAALPDETVSFKKRKKLYNLSQYVYFKNVWFSLEMISTVFIIFRKFIAGTNTAFKI